MKKNSLFLLVILCFAIFNDAFTQTSTLLSNISGTITNEINGDSISNITVKAFNTTDEYSTISNESGFYSMDILPGVYNISFESYDYKNDTINNVELTDGIDTELNTTLYPYAYPVDSIWLEYTSNEMWIYWNPIDSINNGLESEKYYVFRIVGFDPFVGVNPSDGDLMAIGATTTNSKVDTQFPVTGFFAYAVAAIYSNGDWSDLTFSNTYFAYDNTFNIDFNVQLCCEDNNSGINISMQAITGPYMSYNLTTDEDGNTDSLSAVSGFYNVLIQKDGYQDIIIDSLPVYQDSTSFVFTMQENTSLLSNISGTITNEINGDSISNITVKAFNSTDEYYTASDESGFYSMDILPGVYNISFESYDFKNDTITDIELTNGINTELNNILHPFPYPVDSVWIEYGNDSTEIYAYWNPISNINNGLEVDRYAIYRISGFDPYVGESPENGTPTSIGASSSNYKQDFQINTNGAGHYGYAVSVWYNPDTSFSSTTYSETYFPLDLYYDVNFNVQLCCEEINSGIDIFLEGISFPFKTYQITTEVEGNAYISNAIDGYYNLNIQKSAYQELIIDSLAITNGSTDFSFILEENISPPPPTSLSVEPKSSIANWNAPEKLQSKNRSFDQMDAYFIYLDGKQIAEVSNTTLYYTFEDLHYGQDYQALVRAKYGDSISAASKYNFSSEYLHPIMEFTTNYIEGADSVQMYFLPPSDSSLAIPAGLTSFEISRNDELVKTLNWDNSSDTIWFTDNILFNGEYTYTVKAIYDLDEYGFPGETGESLAISSESINVIIFGIGDYQTVTKIEIYPNPANKKITISSEKKINEVQIVNLLGKQVLKIENVNSMTYNIDVSMLSEGTYLAKLIIGNKIISKKFIIANYKL